MSAPSGRSRLRLGLEAACVRLRVANGERKDTADHVVVMVTEVRRLEDSETAPAETQPIGLPPTWSGSTPPLTVASVHPGSERHIDLLHVDWPAGDEIDIARTWSEAAPVHLDLTPKPAGGQGTLTSGRYEISAEVRARNADHPLCDSCVLGRQVVRQGGNVGSPPH
jgi:hypothetical protein